MEGGSNSDDEGVKSPYVLKYVISKESRALLMQELKILSEIDHPNIIRPLKIKTKEQQLNYIALPYCKYGDLFDAVQKCQGISEAAAKGVLKQVVQAVGYLHERSIVHRDLKLENILIQSPKSIKLIDFGFAEIKDSPASVSELILLKKGTPGYMAPELVDSKELGK